MNLYQEQIIYHYKNPQNWGDLPDADVTLAGNNPLCGDIISVKLKFENGNLREMRYLAQGCAISIASASLLSEAINGEKTANIKELNLKDIIKLLGIELGVSRAKCALLPLETLLRGINEFEARN